MGVGKVVAEEIALPASPTVQPLRPEHTAKAGQTLARAFWDDPLMQLVAPDLKRREAVAPWFFGCAVNLGMRHGHVFSNEDASAIAVWFGPGNTTLSPLRMLRAGMGALPFKAGLQATMRFMQAIPVTEKFHKTVKGPHWYLMAIGTLPELQGKGYGSSLVEAGTSRADAEGLACYLETATDADIAFYSKRGFELIGQQAVQGFTLSGMVRQPR